MRKRDRFIVLAALFMLLSGGVAFPLAKIGLSYIDSLPLLAVRFGTGALTIFLILALRERRRGGVLRKLFHPPAVRSGLLCGTVCGVGMILQMVGLGYTTASKGAFINSLYAVLIPVVGAIFFRVRPNLHACLGLAGAVAGMLVFNGVVRFEGGLTLSAGELNVGDLLVLGGALCFAVQLNLVSKLKERFDPLTFSGWQGVAIAALPALIWLIFLPDARADFTNPEIIGILLMLGPISSGLSMSAQILLQTGLSSVQAALIYAVAPVPSALFAAVIPDRTGAVEPLTLQMAVGGGIIVFSVFCAQLAASRARRSAG